MKSEDAWEIKKSNTVWCIPANSGSSTRDQWNSLRIQRKPVNGWTRNSNMLNIWRYRPSAVKDMGEALWNRLLLFSHFSFSFMLFYPFSFHIFYLSWRFFCCFFFFWAIFYGVCAQEQWWGGIDLLSSTSSKLGMKAHIFLQGIPNKEHFLLTPPHLIFIFYLNNYYDLRFGGYSAGEHSAWYC